MTQPHDRSERRRLADRILWLVAALIATYAGIALPLPFKVVAPVFALAAMFAGIRLLREAARGEHTMLVWLAGTAGILGALFFGGIAVSQIILWEPTAAYEHCLAEALTDTARLRCETQYTDSLWN